jgi:hypothetical protein
MQGEMVSQITERLEKLPGDKLSVVYDFVSYLLDREKDHLQGLHSGAFHTMLASEAVLARDWERPEEDAAWADL